MVVATFPLAIEGMADAYRLHRQRMPFALA